MAPGSKVPPGEFKYVVSIWQGPEELCGGSIIAKKFVLTAAHCFMDMDTNEFESGHFEIVITSKDDQARVEIQKIFVLYKSFEHYGDIAVVQVNFI